MDIYESAFIGLWDKLNKNGVRYIMVGGFATNLHGYHRLTEDIDLYIEDTFENRKRLRKTFKDIGMGDFESIETIQFVPGWVDFLLDNGVRLDIMTSLKGVALSFDECLQMAPIAEIENVKVPFLHINQLIDNKRSVNRPKDQTDVQMLESIRQLSANK
ncbi:MAG TPA: nucleotidyltransferase [Puia sp.]|nr:nucleotidyltransferase [Puia sp.]